MSPDKEVPFFGNTEDNTHCFQAALKMVLKYFSPQTEFNYDELDEISAKEKGKWTWPMAALLWMQNHGFDVRLIEVFDYEQFAQHGMEYLCEFYGEEVALAQEKHSNIPKEMALAGQLAKAGTVEKAIPEQADIFRLFDRGYLIMCNVNSAALSEKEGYAGHFVIVTSYDDDRIRLHDPGLPPKPDRDVPRSLFEKAWAYPDEQAKNIMAFKLN